MRISLSCHEWRCPCGLSADAREALENHIETQHPERSAFSSWELCLELSLSQVSDTEHPPGRQQERAVGYLLNGHGELKIHETSPGTELDLRQEFGFGVSEEWGIDTIVLRYPPYDALVSLGGRGFLRGLSEEAAEEVKPIREMLDRAMVALNIAGSGAGPDNVLVHSYTTPLSVLQRILRSIQREIRQIQRGGRPPGARSAKTQALYARIRKAHYSGWATRKELAELFHVSVSTVDRALRGTD